MKTALRILPLLVALLLAPPVHAQDIDHLVTERIPSPLEIQLNLSRHIARLHHADRPDSVDLLLEIWKDRAGEHQVVHRFETLLRLHRGTFEAREFDEAFFMQLVDDRRRTESPTSHEGEIQGEDAQQLLPPLDPRFLTLLDELAEETGARNEPTTDAHLVSLVYRDRFAEAFGLLRSDATRSTALHRERTAMVERIHDGTEEIYSISSVYWTPGGGVDPIGAHPGVNFKMRYAGARYLAAVGATILFGDTDATFVFERDGELFLTDDCIGVEIFLDVGRHLYRTHHHTTTAFVGIGISEIDLFDDDETPRVYESVYAVAPALGLLHRVRPWRYSNWSFELTARYSIVNYDGESGLELEGNTLAVSIGVSGNLRSNPYEALRWLD